MRQKLDLPGLYADALEAMPTIMDGLPPQRTASACPVLLDNLFVPASA